MKPFFIIFGYQFTKVAEDNLFNNPIGTKIILNDFYDDLVIGAKYYRKL